MSWDDLRKLTSARIGIGRTGRAVTTVEHLRFQLDHAHARDAVHVLWDASKLALRLKRAGIRTVGLASSAPDRLQYLKRPDLGRKLNAESRACLKKMATKRGFDVALTISNGLSSAAVHRQAAPVALRLHRALRKAGYAISPAFLAPNARVAISDEIGELTRARLSIILIGERPGLTSSDSLAIYLTYCPRVGSTDAQRNCVSNIRSPGGLTAELAVAKTLYLVGEALRRELSGVDLKEELKVTPEAGKVPHNF